VGWGGAGRSVVLGAGRKEMGVVSHEAIICCAEGAAAGAHLEVEEHSGHKPNACVTMNDLKSYEVDE